MPTDETFTFADELPPRSEPKQPYSDAQRLLDWLQEWKKPVVSTRDIRIYGPRPLRDRKIATSSVEVLVRHGFLAEPTEKRQRNWHQWRVVQKGLIVHPTVAT